MHGPLLPIAEGFGILPKDFLSTFYCLIFLKIFFSVIFLKFHPQKTTKSKKNNITKIYIFCLKSSLQETLNLLACADSSTNSKTKYTEFFLCKTNNKNPAYGRQRISRQMRLVGPIQFRRGCIIYLIFL